jgi:hypothetical protein
VTLWLEECPYVGFRSILIDLVGGGVVDEEATDKIDVRVSAE